MATKRAQSFSTDVIIVVVIILFGALFFIVSKLNSTQAVDINQKQEQATAEAKVLIEALKSQQVLDQDNQVNVEKLLQISESKLRQDNNLKNEFAIVFEKDGKLVKLDPANDVYCVGSSKIIVNDLPCK